MVSTKIALIRENRGHCAQYGTVDGILTKSLVLINVEIWPSSCDTIWLLEVHFWE